MLKDMHINQYDESSHMVRKVGLGVLKRFMRFVKTEDRGTMTSNNVVDSLKEELVSKDATLFRVRASVYEKEQEVEK